MGAEAADLGPRRALDSRYGIDNTVVVTRGDGPRSGVYQLFFGITVTNKA